jgi:hypothetical protein
LTDRDRAASADHPVPAERPTSTLVPAAPIVCGRPSKPTPRENRSRGPPAFLRDMLPVCRATGREVTDQAARSRLPRLTREYPAVAEPSVTCRPRSRNRAHDEDGGLQKPPRGAVGCGTVIKGQIRRPGKRMPATAVPDVGICDGGRRASPSLTSGPFPWLCRLCSGPPAFAVNPRWGYARQKFWKIRFRFVCLRARLFPSRKRGP